MLSSIPKIGNNQIRQLKQNQQSPIQEGYQKYQYVHEAEDYQNIQIQIDCIQALPVFTWLE